MFGRKEKEVAVVNRVPVFSVQTVPYQYELIQNLHVYQQFKLIGNEYDSAYESTINKLGEVGSRVGADAVIGLSFHTFGGANIQSLHAFGTAIRRIDKE